MSVGLFFDGTNNNMDRDKPGMGHTNVVRLYDAYWDKPEEGLYRQYVPGVGTIFTEIGERGESPKLGSGLAWGCEERILFGLLTVLDSIHLRAFKTSMFTDKQIRVLCTRDIVSDQQEKTYLLPLGMEYGLKTDDTPKELLKKLVAQLEQKFKDPSNKVKIGECMVDVFGFSRGAAQARVFCTWLNEILTDGKLAGVIVQLRFVGLFDTVSSYGLVSDTLTDQTRGHAGWAKPGNLQMKPEYAKYCVHMVAMHEFRRNFPLDTIEVGGKLPSNCREFAYPGAHSDVGGGYEPGALGVAVGATQPEGDALKLSQITLNHMFACAVAANVPMTKEHALDAKTLHNPFAINPRVTQAHADFLTESGTSGKLLHEWAQPYLTWRWKVRAEYSQIEQFKKATGVDKEGIKDSDLMRKANQKFIDDAKFIDDDPKKSAELFKLAQTNFPAYKTKMKNLARQRAAETDIPQLAPYLDPEAPMILDLVKKNAPLISSSLCRFFDQFVHDSYAGFVKSLMEPTGYWRYRKAFEGDDVAMIAEVEPNDSGALG
ncbi:T6SS phospholipase effector Tle1-like catalytic domain-containing protein [Collimonas sp. NPDC087041]|uniref:T6SS phospholipase effector Tle1-like catalytic domain-containing protein n=1 Tax=Collimonas sp. NPDC087041 TaxID=3363960 RepID=UPI00381889CB